MPALQQAAHDARHGGAAALAGALQSSRQDTLATFAVCERLLDKLQLPQRDTLNPPLWELGHIGWFQEFWIARNPLRGSGARADPHAARRASLRPGGDALYDSSRVAHDSRWALPLPDANATRADLAQQLDTTLALLRASAEDDDALYFYRLALLHEDMHHEAALYMAHSLGLAIDDARWHSAPLRGNRKSLALEAGNFVQGSIDIGFVFDNERAAHPVMRPATHIDNRVLCWSEYLPFVEAGGYTQNRWWCEAGWAWRSAAALAAPHFVHRGALGWRAQRYGRDAPLDPDLPACHLSAYEAEAWCRWAGRRLPGEAEWEQAAVERAGDFEWGQVWEWTTDVFQPYPGFEPHPYRDYSAPWFGSRRVLRGASFMTQARLRHPRYRNFFSPDRSDLVAGFRTCAR